MFKFNVDSFTFYIIMEEGETLSNVIVGNPINQQGGWLDLEKPFQNGLPFGGCAIYIGADDVTLKNVTVTGGVVGVVARDVNNLTLQQCHVDHQSAWGLYAKRVEGLRVIDSTIEFSQRFCEQDPDEGGCESAGVLGLWCKDVEIANCVFTRCGDGIYFNGEGGRGVRELNIHDCKIYGCPHNSIEATFGWNIRVANCYLGKDQGGLWQTAYPIWCGGSDGVTLEKNEYAALCGIDKSIQAWAEGGHPATNVQII